MAESATPVEALTSEPPVMLASRSLCTTLTEMPTPPAYLPEPAPPTVTLTMPELVDDGMSRPETPRGRLDGSVSSGGAMPAARLTPPPVEVTSESSMLASMVLPA